MRYGMHAIELCIIFTIIRAILRAFLEIVQLLLKIEWRAAGKLQIRFRKFLAHTTGPDGQRYNICNCMTYVLVYALIFLICSFREIHDCLVPVTPYLGGIFKHLRSQGRLPPRIRAMDMRHILLILPFLLEGLLTDEIEEHNAGIRFIHHVMDPSSKMVDIIIMLLSWYRLYRRKFPARMRKKSKT